LLAIVAPVPPDDHAPSGEGRHRRARNWHVAGLSGGGASVDCLIRRRSGGGVRNHVGGPELREL
jgi:hypothetical protein